jgi:hypothetical protein
LRATTSESFALHRRLIGGSPAASSAPALTAALTAASLFGDQVFRNLWLVEILVFREWRQRSGDWSRWRTELRIPDRTKRCGARRTWCRDDLVDVFINVSISLDRRASARFELR